jgi:cytochrome P450
MTSSSLEQIDLLDPELYRGGWPHALYADLRRSGPVLWHPKVYVPAFDVDVAFWAVIGHPEVREVDRDWQTFAATDGPAVPVWPEDRRGQALSAMDPPAHARLRRLISAGFTPRMVGRLEEQIRERTDRILDAAAAKGTVDFVADVAHPLPMDIIGDIIGIPEADRHEVFGIVDTMQRSYDPKEPVTREQANAAEADLFRYAGSLSEAKRARPTDDVWSILANGDLTLMELDLFFLTLTFAGSETSRNAITDGLIVLLDHPGQLDALRRDPALLPGATDEILRWSSPVLAFGRTVTRDAELGGVQLSAGDRLAMFYPSANRDERVFADPFRFDIRRTPNPHVTFGGGGPHYCLGAHLAKTEVQVMIEKVIQRFGTIEIIGEPSRISNGPVNTVGVNVTSLPVRLA